MLVWRVSQLEGRLDDIDRDGTRDMGLVHQQLRWQDSQLAGIKQDLGRLEGAVSKSSSSWSKALVQLVLPLIPVYVLLALAIFRAG